jgi:hypothetical protein
LIGQKIKNKKQKKDTRKSYLNVRKTLFWPRWSGCKI